ncbi:hypothetical protein KBX50_31855, partial [Micromonospora sp. C51]|uniref:hypothetical protein n=1 Tax=Micromonospora sp. C51 TaxID=2824879 RepID=UPI001B3841E7
DHSAAARVRDLPPPQPDRRDAARPTSRTACHPTPRTFVVTALADRTKQRRIRTDAALSTALNVLTVSKPERSPTRASR